MTEYTGFGAKVERGLVTLKRAENNSPVYTVESIDRPGVVAFDISAINGFTASVGDRVFFFVFNDGTGCIIGDAVR